MMGMTKMMINAKVAMNFANGNDYSHVRSLVMFFN